MEGSGAGEEEGGENECHRSPHTASVIIKRMFADPVSVQEEGMRTIALILVLSTAAAADDVLLKHGGKISGRVEERGRSVIVYTQYGVVTLPKDRVARIDRTTSSLLQDYEARRNKADLSKLEDVEELLRWAEKRRMGPAVKDLRARRRTLLQAQLKAADVATLEAFAVRMKADGEKDMAKWALQKALELRRAGAKGAPALYTLGLWARDKGLAVDALVLFQEALTADPDHEFARRALGFKRYRGEWLTEAEVNQAMGLILFEGEWIPPAAKAAFLEARVLQKERELLEQTRQQLAREREDARREYERHRAELERLAREIRNRGQQHPPQPIYDPYPPYPWIPPPCRPGPGLSPCPPKPNPVPNQNVKITPRITNPNSSSGSGGASRPPVRKRTVSRP